MFYYATARNYHRSPDHQDVWEWEIEEYHFQHSSFRTYKSAEEAKCARILEVLKNPLFYTTKYVKFIKTEHKKYLRDFPEFFV